METKLSKFVTAYNRSSECGEGKVLHNVFFLLKSSTIWEFCTLFTLIICLKQSYEFNSAL